MAVGKDDEYGQRWLPQGTCRLAVKAKAELSRLIRPKFKPVDRQV